MVEYHGSRAATTGKAAIDTDPLGKFCEVGGPCVLVAKNNTCELLLQRYLHNADVEVVCVIDAHIHDLDLVCRHITLLTSFGKLQAQKGRHYLLYNWLQASASLQSNSSAPAVAKIAALHRYAQNSTDCRVRLLCRQAALLS